MGTWFSATMIAKKDAGETDVNWGIATLPHPDGVEAGYTVGSTTPMAINANSEHKEEAWEFIKYYVERASDAIAASGNLPTYLPAYSDDIVSTFCEGSGLDESYGAKFFDSDVMLSTNKIMGPNGAKYMQIINDEVQLYFTGEESLEDTLNKIESRVNEEL